MNIVVSQQNKKINITFSDKKLEKNFVVDKSDEFLECVDHVRNHARAIDKLFRNVKLEFENTGLLTERIIRVIILGLSF